MMKNLFSALTQNAIFTSLCAGTITFVVCYASLDHWALGGRYFQSLAEAISLLPHVFIFTLLVGFLVECTGWMYGMAFRQVPSGLFFYYPRIFMGILGGLVTGLSAGALALFLQTLLATMLGLRIFWH